MIGRERFGAKIQNSNGPIRSEYLCDVIILMSVLKWFPLTGRGEGGLQAQESGGGGQKIQGGHQGVKESRGSKIQVVENSGG